MAKAATQLDGPGCFQEATRKARFGHKDWLCWHDRDGNHAVPRSAANIKRMLLAVGTKRHWTLILADSGCPMSGFWAMGINILNQSKRGWA